MNESQSTTPEQQVGTAVVNVPNVLTAARMALATGMFVLQSFDLHFAALIVFILAASTDWVDGFYARRYNQVTKLGRVFDPFVDKFLICGVFIFLVAKYPQSCIHPGLAVVVVSREMLVTALRSAIEQTGGDFSAKWAGKWKMVFQCAAVILSLTLLSGFELPSWYVPALKVTVWAAALLTVYSGVEYIFAAAKFFRH